MGKRMRKKNTLVKEVSGGSEWRPMTARTDDPFNRALMACQVPEWIVYFLSPVSVPHHL